jgi:DNA (cytosine-5)-methyltransferase 1
MKHLDLFTGIGGFAYAAQTVWGKDYEPIAFCEIDKFCQKVLKKHYLDDLKGDWTKAI